MSRALMLSLPLLAACKHNPHLASPIDHLHKQASGSLYVGAEKGQHRIGMDLGVQTEAPIGENSEASLGGGLYGSANTLGPEADYHAGITIFRCDIERTLRENNRLGIGVGGSLGVDVIDTGQEPTKVGTSEVKQGPFAKGSGKAEAHGEFRVGPVGFQAGFDTKRGVVGGIELNIPLGKDKKKK